MISSAVRTFCCALISCETVHASDTDTFCVQQFELRVMCSQQSKARGFTRNRKQEQLVSNAVRAADTIADEQVSLPAQPGQPASQVHAQNRPAAAAFKAFLAMYASTERKSSA